MNKKIDNEIIVGFLANSLSPEDHLYVKDKINTDEDWFNAYLDAKIALKSYQSLSGEEYAKKTSFISIIQQNSSFIQAAAAFMFIAVILYNLSSILPSINENNTLPVGYVSSEESLVILELDIESYQVINNNFETLLSVYYNDEKVGEVGPLDTLKVKYSIFDKNKVSIKDNDGTIYEFTFKSF